jgi:hypothetical protein
MCEDYLVDSLLRHVGQTVTIFTNSGGLSGSGFTGVLAGVYNGTVKIITEIGAGPACPLGSPCYGGCGRPAEYARAAECGGGNCGCGKPGCGGGCGRPGGGYGLVPSGMRGGNWLGAVTEIPVCKIASFTHNSIA